VIVSFRCRKTEALHLGFSSRNFQGVETTARTRLARLNAATSLEDLKAIRGNRLESLRGDRAGEYSIRINDRWRICFRWHDGHAHDVEIVDYH